MGVNTVTYNATANTLLVKNTMARLAATSAYEATITVTGTFGGGTFKLQTSVDGGVTKVDAKDGTNTTWSITANGQVTIRIPCSDVTPELTPSLYGDLSGATSPSITVTVHDNT